MPVVSSQDVKSVVVVTIVKESGSAVLVTASSGGVDWLAKLAVVLNGLATVKPRFSVMLEGADDELVVSETVYRIDSVKRFVRMKLSSEEPEVRSLLTGDIVLADSVLASTTSSVLRIEAAAAVPEVDSSCDVDISTLVAMVLSTVLRMLELAFSDDVVTSRTEDVRVASVDCFDGVGEVETRSWLVVMVFVVTALLAVGLFGVCAMVIVLEMLDEIDSTLELVDLA